MPDMMGNMSPEEYAQQKQLTRQQQMATMLMQQNQQPQGQMVSGRYVPTSFFQNLQPVANMLTGAYLAKQGDTEQAKLAAAIRQNKNLAEQKIGDLAFGRQEISTEMAGPYTGNIPQPRAVMQDAVKPDLAGALREINAPTNYYGAGAEIKPLLYKQLMPELTPEEKRFKAAVADKSWNPEKQGGLNAFLNQMNDKDKASLELDKLRLRNENARLGLAQQEFAFNTGGMMPGGGGGGAVAPQGQAPLRTINPGSPILAPGQQQIMPQGQMPQQGMPQGQMPRFNSKAEQDIYVATQKEKGKLLAEAQNALPGALLTAQTGIDTIRELIGDTKVDAKGNIVYGKQRPKAGFEAAVGMPSVGSLFGVANLFPGSEAADFKAAFEQTSGQAFLGAIGALKGSGAISEIEGAKATAAISRMKLSQSEVEFIKAANDFRDVLEKGYKAAQQKAGGAPINLNAQPSLGGAQTRLVYDPATGTLK